ncbi:MAG: substrate-binding domain-containing protein, partial [Kiritimatiellae bacterium]|nr:substrate-binding domain-containing protein [Kiritimatiellia bacterium]
MAGKTGAKRSAANGGGEPPRVIVSIHVGVSAAREAFTGVVSRINGFYPWSIEYEFDFEKACAILAANPGRYAGMIAEDPGGAESFAALDALGVPVVFTKNVNEGRSSSRRISYVRPDDREIGREAFRHFSRLGAFASWAFAPDSHGRRFSTARAAGFAAALAKRHPGAEVVVLGGSEAGPSGAGVVETLRNLPKPVAIFAASDPAALNVLSLCRMAGVSVPDRAMVLGVDNDTMVCLNSQPTLSSIHPDHAVLGEKAVDELDRLMAGGAGRVTTVRIPVTGVAERGSTRFLPPAEHLVRAAEKCIAELSSRPLRVADVAARLRVSRPLLDLRFRQMRGD